MPAEPSEDASLSRNRPVSPMRHRQTAISSNRLRHDFPILADTVYGKPLIYLDNTATSQTPRQVVEEIERLYTHSKANVHRGVHCLSQKATAVMEAARERVRAFIGADSTEEIIFTRGTTESINLVASSYGEFLNEGDEIILTVMEHHSNIVPWQLLAGRRDLLEAMPPYQGGGEMIGHVSFSGTTWADLPYKFEAGTPDFIDAAALTKAIDYIENVGISRIAAHEEMLLARVTEAIFTIPGLRIYGTAPGKSAILSFLVGDAHHYDTGVLLDQMGIEVRTGHHCAQPLMERFGIEGTVRASFALYNTEAEVDAFAAALRRAATMLA